MVGFRSTYKKCFFISSSSFLSLIRKKSHAHKWHTWRSSTEKLTKGFFCFNFFFFFSSKHFIVGLEVGYICRAGKGKRRKIQTVFTYRYLEGEGAAEFNTRMAVRDPFDPYQIYIYVNSDQNFFQKINEK